MPKFPRARTPPSGLSAIEDIGSIPPWSDAHGGSRRCTADSGPLDPRYTVLKVAAAQVPSSLDSATAMIGASATWRLESAEYWLFGSRTSRLPPAVPTTNLPL